MEMTDDAAAPAIVFLEFDAERIERAMAEEAPDLETSFQHYEQAKVVSQAILENHVCV
ncbi:MAG TPA: hypothetical protein VGB15_23325 [Longimicrobium sp.]